MSNSLPAHPPLRLKDLIKQVRTELEAAVAEHAESGRPSLFTVEGLTLEINVTVKRDETLSAGGGASLFVAELKADAEKSSGAEVVHKVTVQLSAHQPAGSPSVEAGLAGFTDSAINPDRIRSKIELESFDELLKKLKFSPEQLGTWQHLIKKGSISYQPKLPGVSCWPTDK
jgi:hypothetical protein